MKKISVIFLSMVFMLCMIGTASALSFDRHDDTDKLIEYYGTGPDTRTIFTFDLPSWYDSTLVDVFNITLLGDWYYGFNSSTIELFLRDEDGPTWYLAGSVNPAGWAGYSFSHTFNVIASSFDLAMFDSDSSFSVAYGCKFRHDKTLVHIEQHSVPEPATILLIGTGILGLAGCTRKKFRKS